MYGGIQQFTKSLGDAQIWWSIVAILSDAATAMLKKKWLFTTTKHLNYYE